MQGTINLYKWRKARHLSLAELAKKTGLTAAYLSQLEHGKKSPTLRTYLKLCEALNICPHKLVSYDFFCKDDCAHNCNKCD